MAKLDASRTALEVSDVELAVGAMLLATPDHPSLSSPAAREAVGRLEEAGVVDDGRVSGYAAELLSVVAAPKLEVIVEKFMAERTVVDYAWATEAHAVWGEATRDRALELTPVEPGLIPWAISRSVGLGPRADASSDLRISLHSSTLDRAFELLATEGRQAAEDALESDTELEPDSRGVLIQLLLDRQLSWRASSSWKDPERGQQIAWVAVIDGGESGLWLSDNDEDPRDPVVWLDPIRPGAAWDQIVDLMPTPQNGGTGGAERVESRP